MKESSLPRKKDSDSQLETLRIERTQYTQKEFAKRCKIPIRTYQRWVYGETQAKLTIAQFKEICKILNIKSIDELPNEFSPVNSPK